jgi:hypothetical protein
VGTTLTFSAAPPSGTGNISVRYLGIPASGVTTTAYRTVTEFTATAGQTTFSVPSYTVGYIDVYRNGSRLGTADFTATNGTTVVLAAAATAGDLVATESFYVSSVLNAIPATAGAVNSTYLASNLTLGGNTTFGTSLTTPIIYNTAGNQLLQTLNYVLTPSSNQTVNTNYTYSQSVPAGTFLVFINLVMGIFENHANANSAGMYQGNAYIGTTSGGSQIGSTQIAISPWGNGTNSYWMYQSTCIGSVTVASPTTWYHTVNCTTYGTTSNSWCRSGDGLIGGFTLLRVA